MQTGKITSVFRRLFTLFSALSLLLCVVVVMLWMRSYNAGEFLCLWQHSDDGQYVVDTKTGMFWCRGGLGFGLRSYTSPSEDWPYAPPPPGRKGFQFAVYMPDGDDYPFGWYVEDFLGFTFRWSGESLFPREYGFALPFWFVALATFAPAGILYARRLRRRRCFNSGLCPSCGYDLRATLERCPECGRETKEVTA